MQKSWKMTETLANGYSFESTHQELSNEYQHDRVLMILKILCIPMLWTKVPSALEGLMRWDKAAQEIYGRLKLPRKKTKKNSLLKSSRGVVFSHSLAPCFPDIEIIDINLVCFQLSTQTGNRYYINLLMLSAGKNRRSSTCYIFATLVSLIWSRL